MLVKHLPDLSQDYSLSNDQILSFQRDGHILLRNVASSEEIAAYRSHIVDAVLEFDQEAELIEQIAAGRSNGWKFVHNLWERNQVCRRFVLANRFAKIAADLMNVAGVRLLRDESYFKEPGAMATPWHQDCDFFPLNTSNVISMWIALSDISLDMAPMTFASGSHQDGYFEPGNGGHPYGISSQSLTERGFQLTNHGAMAAGDATFHAGWTLHSSAGNSSDRLREALVVVYYEDGAYVWLPDDSNNTVLRGNYLQGCPKDMIRQQHLARCLPGLRPGDLAASSKNPLLYGRKA